MSAAESGSVAGRLRKLEAVLPTDEDVFSGDTRQAAYDALVAALPLLADVAEAAEEVSEARNWPMSEDPGEEEMRANFDTFLALLDRQDEVLARLSEQLEEEGT